MSRQHREFPYTSPLPTISFIFLQKYSCVQYYVHCNCTTQQFNICIRYERIIMVSLVTTCPHTKSYYNIIVRCITYSLFYILHPGDLFHNWRFVLLNPFTYLAPTPLRSGNHSFVLCIYECIFWGAKPFFWLKESFRSVCTGRDIWGPGVLWTPCLKLPSTSINACNSVQGKQVSEPGISKLWYFEQVASPVYTLLSLLKKKQGWELHWWSSGSESTCQCRGYGFHPWSEKLPRAIEWLSPCAATTEVAPHRAHALQQERLPQWEAPQLESRSCLLPGFPGCSDGKESACSAGDFSGSGRPPREGNGKQLQYFCLENPMDRGAWQATAHGVAKSQTRLSNFTHSLVTTGESLHTATKTQHSRRE